MKLAIFDLDHTLIPMDSEWCWVDWMVAHSDLNPEPIKDTVFRMYDEYARGVLDFDEFSLWEVRLLAHFRRKTLDEWRQEFLDDWIKPNISDKARSLVQFHIDQGDEVVLCTAAYSYITCPIARLFGINVVMAPEPEETADGEFTGRLTGEHNFAENKVKAIKNYIAAADDARDELVFYSDSINDRPLFDYVAKVGGRSIAVNADDRLRAYAVSRGWKIIDIYGEEDLAKAALPIRILRK